MANKVIIKVQENGYDKYGAGVGPYEIYLDGIMVGEVTGPKTFLAENGVHTIKCRRYWSYDDSERILGTYQFEVINQDVVFTITVNHGEKNNLKFHTFTEGDNTLDDYTSSSGSSSSGGCYVATCVYGSYDCPEVWTLRRYRDEQLGASWYGRLFIRSYYAVSPTLVKWFGHTKWFKKLFKKRLDKMVQRLQNDGFEDTPYEDKAW